jgi:hypothetical protein
MMLHIQLDYGWQSDVVDATWREITCEVWKWRLTGRHQLTGVEWAWKVPDIWSIPKHIPKCSVSLFVLVTLIMTFLFKSKQNLFLFFLIKFKYKIEIYIYISK